MAKYIIRARIEVEGRVERSDIIGAIFGYTEGLFGEEFDLRELQEKGRIGRISVDIKHQDSKTVGEIFIPSNLDRIETALLAAMIEAVERVGPYPAKIQVVDIIDVRAERLKKIVERAKEIAKKFFVEKAPDLKEVLNAIAEEVRIAELTYYGPEKLPAGPDVDKSDTIIIVEGRADVLNLLRYGYRNVIALEGAAVGGRIPETIIKLASKKKAILFVDGDRMGEAIAREVLRVADIDYVARAPPGKEVEELTAKEIAKALKNAVPASQFLAQLEKKEEKEKKREKEEAIPTTAPQPIPATQAIAQPKARPQPAAATAQPQHPPAVTEQRTEVVKEIYEVPLNVIEEAKKMLGTLEAVLYDSSWNPIERLAVRDLVDRLQTMEYGKVHAVVFDGIITQRLVDVASSKGIKMLIGVRIGNIVKKPRDIILLTLQDLASTT